METVKNLIGEGNYAEAYAILESIDSEEAEQMKSRFRYLPSLLKSDGRVYYEITYNESGLPSKIVYTSTDGDLTIDEYSYDESGKVVTYQNKPQGIDGTSVYNYTYDDAGNKIGEECTLYTGKKTNYSYTYDAGSNMTRLIFTTDTGHSETTDYVYDAGGNLIRMDIFSDGISVGVVEYTYDSNGNLLEQVSTSSSGSKTTESYTYDEKGNLTEKRANGYTYQYSYDENGNCIKVTNAMPVRANFYKTSQVSPIRKGGLLYD